MKKIAVCGCSFMTSSRNAYQKVRGQDWNEDFPIEETDYIKKEKEIYFHNPHFTDIFAEKYKLEVINYAEGGASNLMIRQQIDKAIESKPDLVILGATSPNRHEVIDNKGKILTIFQVDDRTLNKHLSKEKISQLKNYVAFINDDNLDLYKSFYIIQSGLEKLKSLKIPFIFIPGPLKECDWSDYRVVWPNNLPPVWDKIFFDNTMPNHHPISRQKIFAEILDRLVKEINELD